MTENWQNRANYIIMPCNVQYPGLIGILQQLIDHINTRFDEIEKRLDHLAVWEGIKADKQGEEDATEEQEAAEVYGCGAGP